jgi:hypothetical protein
MLRDDAIVLCSDDELGYGNSRMVFREGEGLTFDESYRVAHLPLVAPTHPRVIARKAGKPYDMGRHDRVVSLVLPIPAALHESEACRTLEAELRASPFVHKVAWHILERRRDKLHATICGSLASGDALPTLTADQRKALGHLGPITMELRGLFAGNVNRGRLYLRVYPEKRGGGNVLHRVQRILGCRETDLYVVGVYNLVDDLDSIEASALARLIDRWWSVAFLRFQVDRLWLLAANDDLVLDSKIVEAIPLGCD